MLLVLSLGLLSGGCTSGGSRGGIAYAPAGAGSSQQSQDTGRTTGQLEAGTPPDGEGLDDFELIDPFELEEWNVVSFTDPRDQSVYDIIDGRVLIAFKNAPELPEVDPNYFDVEIPPNDPFYSESYPPLVGDPAVDAFIAAEDLMVYSEWQAIGGIAAVLPEGQTVADAVANWPSEYPDLIQCVDPDSLVSFFDFPQDDPNDDYFFAQWALSEDYPNSDFDIRMQDAWRGAGGYGTVDVVVAVLDTGVTYDLVDMQANSTPYGFGCGDKRTSTTFKYRYQGGGEPSPTWADWSSSNAEQIGHGTCVAGIISAAINNDPGYQEEDGRDTAGIALNPRYLPVEMKCKGQSSRSAEINAYAVVGCVKRIYRPSECGQCSVPFYNVEVVNCSFGAYPPNLLEIRRIDDLYKYMLFVCGAGNEGYGNKTTYPARLPFTMSVAAYDKLGKRAIEPGVWSSNWNWDTDIAAPGLWIRTPDVPGTNSYGHRLGWATDPYVSVGDFGGTSAAAPHVAGVAALVTSKYPSYSPLQVMGKIVGGRRYPLPDDDFTSHHIGGLDAYAALN